MPTQASVVLFLPFRDNKGGNARQRGAKLTTIHQGLDNALIDGVGSLRLDARGRVRRPQRLDGLHTYYYHAA
jgi:hypothetical protein